MAKRAAAMVLALCLMLLVSGCGQLSLQNVNELLRTPALGQGLDEIQNALKSYLGGEVPQYKYPKEGDWRSPLIRTDLNGDGQDEAILLYNVSETSSAYKEKGGNVHVAVLEYIDAGWVVVQDVQGLSAEVASLEVAGLLGDGTGQLIVCYATANLASKTFVLYQYKNALLNQVYQLDYSRYEIGDFTGRGGSELVVVSREDQLGGLQLWYLPVHAGQFATEMLAPVTLDTNFVSCAAITPSRGQNEERLLVVDGEAANENGLLISQFVYYSAADDRFYVPEGTNPLRGMSSRLSSTLKSRDVDGDGIVEVPQIKPWSSISTSSAEVRLEYVEWMDFTGTEAVAKQYGLLDANRSLYVSLPGAWYGSVTVLDGGKPSEWKVQSVITREVVLSLKVVGENETAPIGATRVPGTADVYLAFGNSLEDDEKGEIKMIVLS